MREKIIEILNEVLPDVDVEASETLADDGYIDSISVVDIVSELDVEFDVEVPFEELVNENFNSIDAIIALVERLQN